MHGSTGFWAVPGLWATPRPANRIRFSLACRVACQQRVSRSSPVRTFFAVTMFSNQGPAQEDLRARGSRRNVSKGAGGPPFLRDGPLVPYIWAPDPGPLGNPPVPVAWHVVATHRREPRPRKPCGRPNDAISPTRESRRPPWDGFPLGLLPTGLSPVWLGTRPYSAGPKCPR